MVDGSRKFRPSATPASRNPPIAVLFLPNRLTSAGIDTMPMMEAPIAMKLT